MKTSSLDSVFQVLIPRRPPHSLGMTRDAFVRWLIVNRPNIAKRESTPIRLFDPVACNQHHPLLCSKAAV